MAILVTGGTGLVGSNVAKLLAEQGREVVIFDRQPLPAKRHVLTSVMDRITIEIGSVADLSQILHTIKRNKIEGVIHCAALVAGLANRYPLEALQVNIIGTANVLEAARIIGLKRIVVVSSSGVMGAPEDVVTPRKEEDIVLPSSGIYTLSKLTCEQLTYTYRELYKVNTISVRPRSVYGPGVAGHPRENLPIDVVLDAVAGKPIRYKTGADSSFDLTYVNDMSMGLVQAYDSPTANHYVYNLSYGKNAKMSEVLEVLKGLFPNLPIEVGPGLWEGILARGKQVDLSYRTSQRPPQDITRARKDFGFDPQWPVERAIPDWVQWLKEH
jgi:nucleoside-diphosphate-sugar epimerase